MKTQRLIFLLFLLISFSLLGAKTKDGDKALNTMKRATHYMMDVVSYKGGFVWNYSADLSRRWGELEARKTMVWVQSPGTPDMGHLMLDAYHATGDEYYYESAKKIANALIWGQLPCGGWNYMFDFAGENSTKEWYKTIGKNAWRLEEFQHYYGNATFDDEGTMHAAKFFLRLYVEKYDPAYKEPLDKVIDFVLKSQYPIGGWPQRYPLMYDHVFQGKADYSSFITLNDDVIPENIDFLIQCYQTLGMQNLKEPIMRALNLMIVLQQGKPYAGWADQYTVEDLQPAHARSYEPRSINSGTTVHMIYKMLEYYKLTGESKFISRIPEAISYLESLKLSQEDVDKSGKSKLLPGFIMVPRFVDPEDGKPLYVHRKGSNSANGEYYTDQNISNTIGHYNSVSNINIDALKEAYNNTLSIPREELVSESPFMNNKLNSLDKYYYNKRANDSSKGKVAEILNSFSEKGCWLTPIKRTSNVYKPLPDMPKSNETKYTSTNVGDEYDTSPYDNPNPEIGISTEVFIANMVNLIHSIDKK